MKKLIFILCVGSLALTKAQIPSGYYNGTEGLTGYALKTKLASIISTGYITKTYAQLYTGYPSTDTDSFYENDGTVLDIYSENPTGTDPYNYNHGVKQCGNYSAEGDCYNREHSVPQSLFNEASPMVSDIQHILPTDGYVNGKRSNYPYGKVNNPTWTSQNGSKLGNNSSDGYSGTVFEPINEFKGDVARVLLYFVTRYESNLSGFSDGNILDHLHPNQGLQTWELKLLISWHLQDPVSEREIVRNNAAYAYQNNRNPYIDHPEWVAVIWPDFMAVDDTSFSKNLTIAPNPVKGGNTITVTGDKDLKQFHKVFIYNLVGQNVQTIENPFQNGNTITLKDLPKGIYILKTGELNTKFIVE